MPGPTSVEFALAVRAIGRVLRRQGLVVPSFRSPPRLVGVTRTLRRHPGGAVVAVQLRDRPWVAVLGDLVEGAVVVNRLASPQADRLRTDLWDAVAGHTDCSQRAVA
jgi:hypothetical protein